MLYYVYIVLLVSFSAAVAQPDSIGHYEGTPVVVREERADALLLPIEPLTGTLDLRTAEKIAPSSSLSEVLPLLHSSFDVRSYGTLGGISLPSFRGLAPEYISVYRNGVKLTNAQNSLTDLERYTSRSVTNVSILSSAQSLSMAGDIASAIVNITSVAPRQTQYTAGMAVASYDDGTTINDKEYYLRASQLLDPSSVRVIANYRTSDGAYPFYQKRPKQYVNRSNNDAYLATLEVEPTIVLSEHFSIVPLVIFTEAERGVPGAATIDGVGASSPWARQYDQDWLTALTWKNTWSERYDHQLSVSYQSQYETYVNPTIKLDDAYRNRILAATYRGLGTASEKFSLAPSAEYERSMLESNQHVSSDGIARDRYSVSLTGVYRWFLPLQLRGTLRADKISDIADLQFLPAASVVWTPSLLWNVTASVSRFFHAPTFNQLYWSVGGNPHLLPEQGESYELNSILTFPLQEINALRVQTTLFQTEIREQIIWTPQQNGIWSPVNVQRVRVRGVEIDTKLDYSISPVNSLSLRVAATYLLSQNLTNASSYYKKELPYSTPLRLISSATYDWREVGSLAAVFVYRARRYTDFANNATGLLPFVATIDVHLRVAPLGAGNIYIEPYLAAINLTNEQYEEVLSYPLPGRMLKLGFDFTYKD